MKKFKSFKFSLVAVIVCAVAISSVSLSADAADSAYTTVREIVGLKCPGHDYIRDNHNFTYKDVNGCAVGSETRCLRCHYTKRLHKPQH